MEGEEEGLCIYPRLAYGWYIVGVDAKYISNYGPLLHEGKMHIRARVTLVS